VHSLDYEVDETGKMMLVDVISDPAEAEREHDHNVREDVRQRLAGLPDEQRFLLQLHYGILDMLEDKAPLTVRDVLQERIRQKLASAK
jgi:DNA-directed RNA polymerase sigma subunit (sigma70/sigma32)